MTATWATVRPTEPVGMNCLRFCLVLSNIFVLIGGLIILVIGIWIISSTASFRMLVADSTLIVHSVHIIISTGTLLCVVGFLGCCGAILMSKLMLCTFFIFVLLLFALNFTASVLAFVFYERLQRMAMESIAHYNNTDATYGKEITDGWDELQTKLQCCGVNGIDDWLNHTKTPPPPCREDADEDIPGCENVLAPYFLVLGATGTVIAISQIMSMTMACILYARQAEIEANAPKIEVSVYNYKPRPAIQPSPRIHIKKIIQGSPPRNPLPPEEKVVKISHIKIRDLSVNHDAKPPPSVDYDGKDPPSVDYSGIEDSEYSNRA